MKIHLCILILIFIIITNLALSQTRIGVSFQAEYNQPQWKGFQSNSLLKEELTKNKFFFGGGLGVIVQVPISKNINIETSFQANARGVSFKQKQDSLIGKNKGSYNFFGVTIPANIVFDLPETNYSAKKFIGVGPFINYSVFGILKYSQVGQAFTNEKINFKQQDFKRITYGLNAFVGFEDSQSQQIRLGINYMTSGYYNSLTSKFLIHQLYINYNAFF